MDWASERIRTDAGPQKSSVGFSVREEEKHPIPSKVQTKSVVVPQCIPLPLSGQCRKDFSLGVPSSSFPAGEKIPDGKSVIFYFEREKKKRKSGIGLRSIQIMQ